MRERAEALWDALFLSAAELWTKDQVSNTTAPEALELGHWFQRGQMISKRSLFDGICAMCGVLLYSTLGQNSIASYHQGPPISRDGRILVNEQGVPETEAQPPFLLRFSPQMLAKECPEMFVHDPETNNLRLQHDKYPPWIKKLAGNDRTKTWLYCFDLSMMARWNMLTRIISFIAVLAQVWTVRTDGAPTRRNDPRRICRSETALRK